MSKRAYVSPVRDAASAAKREHMLGAAIRYLRDEAPVAGFSLEAVAKAAGVTRLTLYNQFGSRRGLLEAVFDEIADHGRLTRLGEAMGMADARAGLAQLIEVFCDFWSGDPAVARLHDAMGSDPELAEGLFERNERRRPLLGALVSRIGGDMAASDASDASRDAVDMIFVLTSLATFRMLAINRSKQAVCGLIQDAAWAAIDRMQRATHFAFDRRE